VRQPEARQDVDAESPSEGEPRLVVPAGLVLDEVARHRLERQLDRAAPHISGVVAPTGPLAAGASYRVCAEWRSLEPQTLAVELTSTSALGAMLLRPGVEFEVKDRVVDVGRGTLVLDPGAHVHDPWQPIEELRVASEFGRSPFPRRPIVVFVGRQSDAKLADWARRLVNRLIRRDVEARLALPIIADGLHLTCPLLPCEASMRALAPDAVVALDPEASALAQHWCRDERSTVFIELDPEQWTSAELVSWQIGRSSGRVRARIGRRIHAPALSALVRRLCAGPQPAPPVDGAVPEKHTISHGRRARELSRARSSCAVVTGALDPSSAARVEGLVDHMSAVGITVGVLPIDRGLHAGAATASLAVLTGIDDVEAISELVAVRAEARRPTVFDVGPRDLESLESAEIPPSLTPAAARVAASCGLATSAGGAMHSALRSLGVRALVVPTMLTRRRAAELRDSRRSFDPQSEAVIGWHLGTGTPATTSRDEAGEGVAKVLANRFDVRVLVVGDAEHVPPALRGHDYLVELGELEPETLAGLTVQLWTPEIRDGMVADDLRAYLEASHAGVPTVLPSAARVAIDGHASPPLVVHAPDEPEQWTAALRHVLDSPSHRGSRAKEASDRSDAVESSAASKTVVNRLIGWALYETER
jgi:hypothetical protein